MGRFHFHLRPGCPWSPETALAALVSDGVDGVVAGDAIYLALHRDVENKLTQSVLAEAFADAPNDWDVRIRHHPQNLLRNVEVFWNPKCPGAAVSEAVEGALGGCGMLKLTDKLDAELAREYGRHAEAVEDLLCRIAALREEKWSCVDAQRFEEAAQLLEDERRSWREMEMLLLSLQQRG